MNILKNPRRWIAAQIAHDAPPTVPIQNMLYRLCLELYEGNRLVSFAYRSMLLWPRCTPGENLDDLPAEPKELALTCIGPIGLSAYEEKELIAALKERGISCTEKYPVHPDRFAFAFARGQHPNDWTFHHLYDGIVPFHGRKKTLDAQKHGRHFTETAGMVTVHPLVQELYDHCACIRRTLRARSFTQFKYDPDEYFEKGRPHNERGFVISEVIREGVDAEEDLPEDVVAPRPGTFGACIQEKIAARRRGPRIAYG